MKQKTLYIILAICLIIIIVLLTILVTSQNNSNSQYHHHLENTHPSNKNIIINNRNYPNYQNSPTYGDLDYAYDYDGYWFQPSRWWNNLWNRRRNIYDRRDHYDRRDGLDMHNRYINNSIHINPIPNTQSNIIKPFHNESSTNQQFQSNNVPIPNTNPNTNSNTNTNPIISLVKPLSGSDFPLPTLSSSSPLPMMPEEISISPMSKMSSSENVIQTISTFTSDIPSSYQTGYVSNFNYKGPDSKNQKPFPVDMMASESIFLQPNTIANQIITPSIVMDHPNPM